MKVDDESFGVRLRRLRTDRGLTQQDLAGDRFTAAYVSHLESDKRNPSPKALGFLSERLGVDPDELASGVPSSLEAETELTLQKGWRDLFSGRYDEARKRFRSVERVATRFGRDRLRGKAIIGRGRVAERQGQTVDALAFFERAHALLAEQPLPVAVEAIAGAARCRQMMGETRLALHILESCLLELQLQDLTDPAALMRVHSSLVWPYSEMGLYDKASAAALEALRLEAKVEAPEELIAMHLNVARSLVDRGQIDDALRSLDRAEELCRQMDWRTELGRAHTNRGIVYVNAGKLDDARVELQKALVTFEATGFHLEVGRVLNELARLERRLGNLDGARGRAQKALELLAEMDAVAERALAHRELALAIRDDHPKEAEKHLRAAIDLYQECGETLHAADTYRLLGDLLTGGDTSDSGRDAYREGLALVSESLDRHD